MADANLDIRVTSKGIKEAQEALRKLGVNADAAEEAVKQYTTETKKSTAAQKQYTTAQTKSNEAVNTAATVHTKARGGFRAMRGATQQVSFQLQDIAVQAQSGTAGLTILAQQGPQLLSVFGPAGAVAGALVAFGALIGSVFLSTTEEAEEEVDDLKDALGRLNLMTDRSKGGVFALSQEFAKLAKESRALAELEIELDISRTQRGLEKSITDIEEALDFDIIGSGDSFRRYEETIKNLRDGFERGATVSLAFTGRIREAGKAVGLTGPQFNKLALALAEFEKGRTPELFADLQKTVKDLRSESSDTKAYDTFADVFVKQARNVRLATGALQDLQTVQSNIQSGQLQTAGEIEAVEAERAAFDKMIADQIALRQTADEKFFASQDAKISKVREAVMRGVIDSARADELIASIERTSFQRLQETTEKKAALAIRAGEAGFKAFQKQQQEEQKQLDARIAANRLVNSILAQEDDKRLVQLEASQQRQRDRLREDLDAKRIDITEYYAALAELETEYGALVNKIQDETAEKNRQRQIQFLENNMTALERWVATTKEAVERIDLLQVSLAMSLESNMANAFEGILTGTMNAKEAFQEFARGMISSFLAAIAQMIAKRMALAIVEKTLTKASAASVATYMGLTASAQSIMAGINAYASTAAIPVYGPAAAPAAMATAIGVTAPLAAAVTATSAAAAAARATGGQVMGGQSYLVGERGPELLTMGGSGRVSSNDQLKKAMGGGDGITIVNNVDARGADASVDVKIRKAMQETAATTIETIRDLSRRRRFV